MKDALGRPISPGDYLVYPQRRNSTMWLTLAHVTAIDGARVTVDRVDLDRNGRLLKGSYTEQVHRAVIIPHDAVPERYRAEFEGPLVWDDHSPERIRKKE